MVFLGCFVGFVRGFYGFLGEKQLSPLNRIYHLGSCQGEVLVRLPAAAAVSVSMDASAPAEPSLAPLEGWWMRHPRSSIRLAAKLVFQRETFAPYIEMLYPLEQIYAPWLWPKEDLRFLPPRMVKSALARKEALETAYEDLESEGLSDRIPRDLFLRAHHAAASRAFAGEAASVQRVAPFLGMLEGFQCVSPGRSPGKSHCSFGGGWPIYFGFHLRSEVENLIQNHREMVHQDGASWTDTCRQLVPLLQLELQVPSCLF